MIERSQKTQIIKDLKKKFKINNLGKNIKLQYLRTKDGREVDFVLSNSEKIKKIIEVKLSDSNLGKNLLYFCDKYSLEGIQLVKNLKQERSIKKIDILKADNYLTNLYL